MGRSLHDLNSAREHGEDPWSTLETAAQQILRSTSRTSKNSLANESKTTSNSTNPDTQPVMLGQSDDPKPDDEHGEDDGDGRDKQSLADLMRQAWAVPDGQQQQLELEELPDGFGQLQLKDEEVTDTFMKVAMNEMQYVMTKHFLCGTPGHDRGYMHMAPNTLYSSN